MLTQTYKSATVQFAVSKNAEATAITGTKDLTTGAQVGQTFTVVKENIKVADQYGREGKVNIDNYKIFAYFPDEKQGNNAFDEKDKTYTVFAAAYGNAGKITGSALINKKGDSNPTDAMKAKAGITVPDDDPITKVRFVLAPNTYGSKNTDVDADALADNVNDGKNVISTYDVTFTAVNKSEFKSYEVADLGTVYMGNAAELSLTQTDYNKTFDVKAVTADSTKVKLVAGTDFTVRTDFDFGASNVVDDDKITSTDLTGEGKALKDKETAEVKLTFTFTDGQSIEKTVVISKAKPQVKEVKIKDDKDVLEISADTNTDIYSAVKTLIEAKDQYGVDIATKVTSNVTVSDLKDEDKVDGKELAVTDNGKAATFVNLAADDTATIKLTFDGGFTFTGKIVAKTA